MQINIPGRADRDESDGQHDSPDWKEGQTASKDALIDADNLQCIEFKVDGGWSGSCCHRDVDYGDGDGDGDVDGDDIDDDYEVCLNYDG